MRLRLLLLVLLLTGPGWAQGPGNPVKPLERSPHIFYEPQVKYPPQGADEAFGGALPLALAAALGVFGGVFWLTRPVAQLELALDHAHARAESPAATVPVVSAAPAAPAAVADEPREVAEEPRPVAREPVAVVREEPLPAPPPPRREAPRRLAGAPVGARMAPPAESPLRRFSWSEAAETTPLPLVPGESTGPGLVAYLAPAAVRPRLLAATAAALLEGTKGRVILLATGVTPVEVIACLGGDSPEAVRRNARRLERLARRLYLPRGGTLPVERLLRAAEDASAVVLDSASRLEMGAPEPSQWLRDLHGVGSHGGFPVFLVADPASLPPSAPAQRTFAFETWPPAPRELALR